MQKGVDDDTRRLLVKLASRRATRSNNWSSERPTEWRPQTVRDPDSGFFPYFSSDRAWDLVASVLEKGHPVEAQSLDKPSGAVGFVLKIRLQIDEPLLYVKLELGKRKNFLFGRSFHYSRHG